jgi:uncharacterized protein (TIGR02271 family)
MNYEKIVTLFDTPEHAEAARRNLELAGFPGSEISVVSRKALSSGGETLREPGLWHRLFGRDIEEHEATVYGRTVESGGVVLTIRVPEADVPKVMGILNAHKPVDVQDRAVEQGLISSESVPKAGAAAVGSKIAAAAGAAAAGVRSAAAGVGSAAAAAPPPAGASKEEVLRLAEEQLDVGKRLVEQGTTRIRRFVTEKPVEAKVTLHEEHADVIRRAAANPASLAEIDWSDKTIEVRETAEEAVVSKSAHIREEVVIGKKGTEREETVRDTVRRQEAEVERTPGGGTPKKGS